MFLCFRDLRQGGETFLQLFISRDVIGHIAIIKLLIAFQIEIACSGQTKEDRLLLTGLFAFQSLVNGCFNRMCTFRCRKGSFTASKEFCCLKDVCLFCRNSSHIAVMIQLGKNAAHTMEPQTACVVG